MTQVQIGVQLVPKALFEHVKLNKSAIGFTIVKDLPIQAYLKLARCPGGE